MEVDPKLLEWAKEKLEMMTTYDDHHWTAELEDAFSRLFTSTDEDKLFVWIEN